MVFLSRPGPANDPTGKIPMYAQVAPAGDPAFCPVYQDAVRSAAKRLVLSMVCAGTCPEQESEKILADLDLADA